RVALAARVRATTEDAVVVDGDRLRAARYLRPVSEKSELMALAGESFSRGLREAALDLQRLPCLVIPARLLDSALDVEAMVDETDGELEIGLHLRVAPGRAEDEAQRRPVERDDRVERVHGTLSWCDRVGR